MSQIPEGFGLYDVKGAKDNPKLITHETAEELKAKPHGEPEAKPDTKS
jgi:hypothetical protein